MNNLLFSKTDLRKLIIPIIIEQTLAVTVGMFDTVMTASVGESAMSGVSLADTINVLIINLFTALATGGAIVSAQHLGAKDKENSNCAAKQLIISTFFFSLFIMIICLLLNHQMISLCFGKIENDVVNSARTYFYITALSYPFIALFNAAAALFRSMGNSKSAMINAFIMNIANIVFNALFIYVLKQGVFGAALATLISRIIAAVSMMRMLRNPDWSVSVRSYSLKDIDFLMIKRILRIGIPNGLENSIFQTGRIIMTGLIAALGTASIAAHAVGTSLTGIEVIPGIALGLALITVAAQCTGAKDYEQVKYYTRYLIKLSYIFLVMLNLIILIILKPILGMYNLSPETFFLAFKIMLIHGIGTMIIWTPSFVLPNALRAASDVKYPMFISIFSMFVFRIGFSFLFVYIFNMGVLSVWFAMVIDWVFRSICFVRRWKSGKWIS